MAWNRVIGGVVLVEVAVLAFSACGPAPSTSARPARSVEGLSPQQAAYVRLQEQLETFKVEGAVRTSEGLLLPETITIEIRSEVCVESRQPGARFWSLDYDTCFTYTAVDSLDEKGEYSVSVPCLDADRTYETSHAFGDLRVVQRGPVSFVASSDAGWRHQETFSSSRTQRRDLILTLDTDTFYVVRDPAVFRERPEPEATVLKEFGFGTGVEVVRFHQGWAQCLMGRKSRLDGDAVPRHGARNEGTGPDEGEAASRAPAGVGSLSGPSGPSPDAFVEDARGLLCPIPVINLAKRVGAVGPGQTVLLIADDPLAEQDVRLWAKGQGQEVVDVEREGNLARIRVRRLR